MQDRQLRQVVIGRVAGVYGVRGWIRVLSWVEPRQDILDFPVWQLQQAGRRQDWQVAEGRLQGKSVIARLEGLSDREQARGLMGAEIAVARSELPALNPGQYYWADLIGLKVRLKDGRELGRVEAMMETGANDVLVVKGERERLIPFVHQQVVQNVDLEAGLIQVDWDPDF